MNAATTGEWLTAAAIGTATLPLLWLAVRYADRDVHLPHLPVAPALDAAGHATQQARLHLAAWLVVLAWHLRLPQGGAR
ncbi:hypothetical protein GCM10010294_25410 [Streptomyces griseoloalbus]|uniref:hypothetical protein n=1 Tax=Streptomyces griseoloalbus TaxID=67303 RepID=UPI001876A295|nr:hypothetical protein GCM10010294_25410 [Streptomyces griseoloalbus]